MRRSRQQMSHEDSLHLLKTGSHGVLSLIDVDGSPYGLPINYVFDGGSAIYIHSAIEGHKLDCISGEDRCSFCVVGQDVIVPEEFTSYYRSVIVSGRIKMVESQDDVLYGLKLLCERFSPCIDSHDEITRCLSRVAVLRLDIERVAGKESIELVRQLK
ncbi:MAG: pyridoxamine 5'-phosphate oxidase family protein [Duncaniella sp.]|nr:pyridoxamine 5'-phosphate oxidase family protein [Duncaniella sp.]